MANEGGSKKPQQLPKNAIERINLGQSFAEYDKLLTRPGVMVQTPAITAALDADRSKCFFVGRRGTGKTAITRIVNTRLPKRSVCLIPQVIVPQSMSLSLEDFRDSRQRPFKSLVACFRRALQDEAVAFLCHHLQVKLPLVGGAWAKERQLCEQMDFDERFLCLYDQACESLGQANEREWFRFMKAPRQLAHEMNQTEATKTPITLMVDRIDEAWDGTDLAVVFLMAMMHAVVEMAAESEFVRPMLFLRENIFERVRQIDNEFTRLETCVVSLDWTYEQLLEMVERRLNEPFNTKMPIGGTTWDYFFPSEGVPSRRLVFEYCQRRPRDILTLSAAAIGVATSRRHATVQPEDLTEAKTAYSRSRLKDLGDEYGENYPSVSVVLGRFFGLGREFTIPAIASLLERLIVDGEVQRRCGGWINFYLAPNKFIELMYGIGFFGVRTEDGVLFRSMGVNSEALPKLVQQSRVVIHPSFAEALHLQERIMESLPPTVELKTEGVLEDIAGVDAATYDSRLEDLQDELTDIPLGREGASRFEEIVGEVVRLCFIHSLTNVEAKCRTIDGRLIKDWVASNVAEHGFWGMIRDRYSAVQVFWEAKNYSHLDASDFHQILYYLSNISGNFGILVFRGDMRSGYYEHIKAIANKSDGKSLVLLLTERDLRVFLRQARHGKHRDAHLRDIFDRTIRLIA